MRDDRPVVPYRSWNKIRNNGDAITAPLIDRIFDAEPVRGAPDQPHLIATGSIMFLANSASTVWGAGLLNHAAYLPDLRPDQIRAVRGRLSADRLVGLGVRLKDIPFGDPGLLVNQLVKPADGTAGRPIALVPHHDSITLPFFRDAARRNDVCLVDMLDCSLLPVRQIAECEVVISQSLHGLVYATALGKPCLWISNRSDDIWNFKFLDWHSTVHNGQSAPCMMSTGLDAMVRLAEPRDSAISAVELMAAFPGEIGRPAAGRLMSFERCRQHDHVSLHIDRAPAEGAEGGLASNLAVLHRAHKGMFRRWAEPTYAIASLDGADALPTPSQARAIIRKMDEASHVGYGMVVQNRDFPATNADVEWLPDGIRCIPQPVKSGRVFVLRPSFPESGPECLTFGIP